MTLENPEVYLVSKIFTAIGGGINLLWNAAWFAQITGMPFNREKLKAKKDAITGDLEKMIVTNLLDLQSLTSLNLEAWDGVNLFFLEQMPHLKRFKVNSSSPIFADALGNMLTPHDLETLHLSGPINLSSFEGWSKFYKLKKLHLDVYFVEMNETGNDFNVIQDPDQINNIARSLVKNLPQLESLSVAYIFISNLKLYECISQLQNLIVLDLRDSFVSDHDLSEIAKIKTLKKLALPSYLNNEKSREKITKGIQKLYNILNLQGSNPYGLIPLEPCTQSGLDYFQLRYPDIELAFKEPKKVKINIKL